jgi:hypothetical protein
MDQNRYINAYVDIVIGQLHEMLSNNLQLKTQNRLANEIIQEKDNLIGDMQNQLNVAKNNDNDVQTAKEKAKQWEDLYHTMVNKVAHMETLLNQVKDMKTIILEKDKIILELQQNIKDLKTPKKVINIKPKKKVEEIKLENSIDDF